MKPEQRQFGWKNSGPAYAHGYLLPAVLEQIRTLYHDKPIRILDVGCGNGYVAWQLAQLGHTVMAIDASRDGIELARSAYPGIQFEVRSLYDDNIEKMVVQSVDCVISLEVIEHLFSPRELLKQSYRVLKSGGHFIASTPYHGYLKNLATSVVDGWDRHFNVNWDGGHIKFFSKRTLAEMAHEVGFKNMRFQGAGRLPWLWKSMILTGEK